jgi:hypothetical protein
MKVRKKIKGVVVEIDVEPAKVHREFLKLELPTLTPISHAAYIIARIRGMKLGIYRRTASELLRQQKEAERHNLQRFHLEANGDVWEEIAQYARAAANSANDTIVDPLKKYKVEVSKPAPAKDKENCYIASISIIGPAVLEDEKFALRIVGTTFYDPQNTTNGQALIVYFHETISPNRNSAGIEPAKTLRGGEVGSVLVDRNNRIVFPRQGETAEEIVHRARGAIYEFVGASPTPQPKPRAPEPEPRPSSIDEQIRDIFGPR